MILTHVIVTLKKNWNRQWLLKIYMEELYKKLNHIKEKPYTRPLVHDKLLASFGIRSIKVKNYLLFYSVEEENNNINVITFMYNKRDWENIIKEIPLDDIM